MKEYKLRHISPKSLAKNLALLFFCFGLIASIITVFAQLIGAEATLRGPIEFSESASRSPLLWVLNPFLIAAYGYVTGLLGAFLFNLAANKTGGLVYSLDSSGD